MPWRQLGAPLALALLLAASGCDSSQNADPQNQADMGQDQADSEQEQDSQDLPQDTGAGEDLASAADMGDDASPDATPDMSPAPDQGTEDLTDDDMADADLADTDMADVDMETPQVVEPLGWPTIAGDYTLSLESGGRTRSLEMHVPPQAAQGQAVPVLLVLHGGNGTGARLQSSLGFDAYADRDGVVVIYPDGIENNWSDGRGTTDAELAGVDDIGFLGDLLDQVEAHAHLDAGRVWVTGVSNGGIMSHRVACDLSERVAAVAPVISAFPTAYLEACQPARPIPMVALQGTADEFINLEGGDASHEATGLGDGGLIESAEATAAFWAQHNGCAPAPQVQQLEPISDEDDTRVELRSWRGCDQGASIDYYIVHGMGHVWPPLQGALPRISGPTSHQISATEVVWSFVTAHRLP